MSVNLRNRQGQLTVPCSEVTPPELKKTANQSLVFSAITMTSAVWKSGDKGTITITFGGYNCDGCSPDAAWSQIGKHSNGVVPSMNLGFIDPPYKPFTFEGVTYTPPASATRNYCGNSGPSSCRSGWVPGATVIHEFGHALGMMHEHQNNLYNANPLYDKKGPHLNKANVIAYYTQLGMGRSGAATNVLDSYSSTNVYGGTKFDPKSIMLYYLPDNWISGKNPTYPNFVLSKEDIGWLQTIYPKSQKDPPVITVKFIDRNPEPWKMAWVKKVITETYGQIISVKWNFIIPKQPTRPTRSPKSPNRALEANTDVPTNAPTDAPTDAPRAPNVPGTNLPPLELGLAIGIPLAFALFCLALYFRRPKKDLLTRVFGKRH